MRVTSGRRGRLLQVAVAVACLAGWSWAQEGRALTLRLRGVGLNLTGVGKGRSGETEIGIERWTTDEESDLLRRALAQTGVPGLTGVLLTLAPRAGYVQTRRGGFADLKYARQELLADGGQRIVLATGRLGVPSDGSNPHAETHDFLVVEIRLDPEGKGEGRSAGAERLRYNKDKGTLELDRYGAEPVWIRDLHISPEYGPKP